MRYTIKTKPPITLTVTSIRTFMIAGMITHYAKGITRGPRKGVMVKRKLKEPIIDLRLTLITTGTDARPGDYFVDEKNYEYRYLGDRVVELQHPVRSSGYEIPKELVFIRQCSGNFNVT